MKLSIANSEGGGDLVEVWDTGEGKGEMEGTDLMEGGDKYSIQVEIRSVVCCSGECILLSWLYLLQASSDRVVIICDCSTGGGE